MKMVNIVIVTINVTYIHVTLLLQVSQELISDFIPEKSEKLDFSNFFCNYNLSV